eukprot:2531234-Rhodomonas_salina.1
MVFFCVPCDVRHWHKGCCGSDAMCGADANAAAIALWDASPTPERHCTTSNFPRCCAVLTCKGCCYQVVENAKLDDVPLPLLLEGGLTSGASPAWFARRCAVLLSHRGCWRTCVVRCGEGCLSHVMCGTDLGYAAMTAACDVLYRPRQHARHDESKDGPRSRSSISDVYSGNAIERARRTGTQSNSFGLA